MKKQVRQFAHRLGFQISKSPHGDAFGTLKHLCGDKAEPVIFDVGAYQGLVSLRFHELFPKARIFSFEPFASSFESAKKNTEHVPQIECFNFGLSDTDGPLHFHQNKGKATNSLLESNPEAQKSWGTGVLDTEEVVEVEMKKLDTFLAEKGIEQVDLLKIDVQGAEYLVMAGAREACEKGRISTIYSEVIAQPTYLGQRRFDKGLSTFYEAGFDLVNFFDVSVRNDGVLRQVDAVFRKSL